MSWTIEQRGRVAIVTMTTNPVNAQNRAFFADLHEAFDRLESEYPECPVVLTGTGARFSAGLDLGEHFPLFAGDTAAVASWFQDYRATNMRLFTYPRPTVAAVNGHAFAGGLITAAVCDYRVSVAEGARFGLNEVPIGIPMPAVYVRMLAHAWGDPVAARTCLLGETFTPDQAHALGMVHELAPADELLDRAVAIAGQTPEDCIEQYAFTKRACQAASLRDIADLADPLDKELPDGMTSDQARHAHRRYWQQLKGRPATWWTGREEVPDEQ
ncbi:enoyl-CoA hydratase/isomerase family protein [Streptomyces sp. NPDC087850]|uniref:enoyl-CoA hydratase/isomerase family protein n=1 Tax=Streptomyces sp. NPDC087850 TaxID=3365809 RepID=UPI0037FCD104